MEKQIITPNIAIFKEGEVYVYTLPEEPKQISVCNEFNMRCSKRSIASCVCAAHKDAISYARAHPFKVHEKDKEIIEHLIWDKIEFHSEHESLNWQPQDLTEYRIEGVRMEIKHIFDSHSTRNGEECTITMCYFNDFNVKEKCLRWCKQVACLIEDDGVKEKAESHSSKVLDDLLNEITPEEQEATNQMMIKQSPSEGYFKVKVSEDGYITLPVDVKRMPAIINVESPSEVKEPDLQNTHLLKEVDYWQKSAISNQAKINELESKLKELEKSDQEALAKAWIEGYYDGSSDASSYEHGHIKHSKNPYTKE